MQKFQLELLFHIIGIGSASGLFYKGHSLFVISDNGGYLYEYKTDTKTLEKKPLTEGNILENIPKKDKPDFESLVHYGNKIYAFGSGSTQNRNKMVTINTETQTITTSDLSDLYAAMQSFGNIKSEDFNIEGVAYGGEDWYFFQRGNGGSGKNGVFTISGENLESNFMLVYKEFKLPKINGVRASFTDAVLSGKTIYFLATAEDTQSTYDDGKIFGSLIGTIDTEKMKITSTEKISDTHKFEGIALSGENKEKPTFFLCEDNDTELQESKIYKLTLGL